MLSADCMQPPGKPWVIPYSQQPWDVCVIINHAPFCEQRNWDSDKLRDLSINKEAELGSNTPVSFFKKRFYLFLHERHTERGRDIHRGWSRLLAGSQLRNLSRDQDDDLSRRRDVQLLSHPGVPVVSFGQISLLVIREMGLGHPVRGSHFR